MKKLITLSERQQEFVDNTLSIIATIIYIVFGLLKQLFYGLAFCLLMVVLAAFCAIILKFLFPTL